LLLASIDQKFDILDDLRHVSALGVDGLAHGMLSPELGNSATIANEVFQPGTTARAGDHGSGTDIHGLPHSDKSW
jgi:hypothetical protein